MGIKNESPFYSVATCDAQGCFRMIYATEQISFTPKQFLSKIKKEGWEKVKGKIFCLDCAKKSKLTKGLEKK